MSDGAIITLPVLPLRDIVVFPHMIVPLFVGREKSIRALEAVMAEDKHVQFDVQSLPTLLTPRTCAGKTRQWMACKDRTVPPGQVPGPEGP